MLAAAIWIRWVSPRLVGTAALQNITKNALKVLEVIGRQDIKVYPGHSCPLVAPLVTAPPVPRASGMDGPVLPEPSIKAQEKHGVDFIIDTVMGTDDVTLIATGPLTNIAAAINKEPGIVGRVKELSIMGGSVTYRNWTPAAEFNIFVDPKAAYRVFNSGMHVKMCGVNLTRQCFLVQKACGPVLPDRHAQLGCLRPSWWSISWMPREKNASLAGANIHDACAVAWLIDES